LCLSVQKPKINLVRVPIPCCYFRAWEPAQCHDVASKAGREGRKGAERQHKEPGKQDACTRLYGDLAEGRCTAPSLPIAVLFLVKAANVRKCSGLKHL